jgi:hypothetical protein
VRRLKAIVTVMVLAVWSACTAHCAIESLTRATALPCCDEDGGPSDQVPNAPGHCVCSSIQSGGYVPQETALAIALPLDGLCWFEVPPRDEDMLARPGIVEVNLSPPELVGAWQFFFRAALPARAPSLVS